MAALLLSIAEIDEPRLKRWRALAAEAEEANAFFEPEFVLPATRAATRDAPRLLVIEDGERWEACVPLVDGRWKQALPAWRTWRGMYGYLGTPLVAGGRPGLGKHLVEELSAVARGRSISFEWLMADAAADRAIAESSPPRHRLRHAECFERALLVRRQDGEYLRHLKPRHLREARRLRRRLSEEIGEVTVADRAGDADAVEAFLAVERKGWKGRSETAMASKAADAAFFRSVCEGFAAAGRLQLLELRAGDEIIAMKCNLIAGKGAFAFKIAFDEAYARFSPGIQLELENIEHFHRSGLMWMDSCADRDNAMINRLWTERRGLESLVFVRESASGRAVYRGLKAAMTLRGRYE